MLSSSSRALSQLGQRLQAIEMKIADSVTDDRMNAQLDVAPSGADGRYLKQDVASGATPSERWQHSWRWPANRMNRSPLLSDGLEKQLAQLETHRGWWALALRQCRNSVSRNKNGQSRLSGQNPATPEAASRGFCPSIPDRAVSVNRGDWTAGRSSSCRTGTCGYSSSWGRGTVTAGRRTLSGAGSPWHFRLIVWHYVIRGARWRCACHKECRDENIRCVVLLGGCLMSRTADSCAVCFGNNPTGSRLGAEIGWKSDTVIYGMRRRNGDWSAEEYARFEALMKGRRGIQSPGLDPWRHWVLRLRSDETPPAGWKVGTAEFAGQKKELAFQQEVDAARKRLWSEAHRSVWEHSAGWNREQRSASRQLFVQAENCSACDARLATLLAGKQPFDIYIAGDKGDDNRLEGLGQTKNIRQSARQETGNYVKSWWRSLAGTDHHHTGGDATVTGWAVASAHTFNPEAWCVKFTHFHLSCCCFSVPLPAREVPPGYREVARQRIASRSPVFPQHWRVILDITGTSPQAGEIHPGRGRWMWLVKDTVIRHGRPPGRLYSRFTDDIPQTYWCGDCTGESGTGITSRSALGGLWSYTNLHVAARILRRCYEGVTGSWIRAAGCYHHPAGGQPGTL